MVCMQGVVVDFGDTVVLIKRNVGSRREGQVRSVLG